MVKKSFIVDVPARAPVFFSPSPSGVNVLKLFYMLLTVWRNKLDCLSLKSFLDSSNICIEPLTVSIRQARGLNALAYLASLSLMDKEGFAKWKLIVNVVKHSYSAK
jgi:hypothetical protein